MRLSAAEVLLVAVLFEARQLLLVICGACIEFASSFKVLRRLWTAQVAGGTMQRCQRQEWSRGTSPASRP